MQHQAATLNSKSAHDRLGFVAPARKAVDSPKTSDIRNRIGADATQHQHTSGQQGTNRINALGDGSGTQPATDNFYTSTVYEKGAEVIRMIQTLIGLGGDGSGLAVTVARYVTPSGRDIQNLGIEPDRLLPEPEPLDPGGRGDSWLEAAVDQLSAQLDGPAA